MKTKLIILLITGILALVCPVAAKEQEKGNEKKASVKISLKIRSEIDGSVVEIAPAILTKDGRQALIEIGGRKAHLNGIPLHPGNKVKSPGQEKPPAGNFTARIEILPEIVKGDRTDLIKSRLTVKVNHMGKIFEKTLHFTTVDGESLKLDSFWPESKSRLLIEVLQEIPAGT